MRLYQHSARCPIALAAFLHCNPNYWCFIPLHGHEAQNENRIYFEQAALSHDDDTTKCLARVPLPPAAYAFSYRQQEQQRVFFNQLLSMNVDQLPHSPIDLYQVAMIAVCKSSLFTLFSFLIDINLVPEEGEDCSTILRYIIETLFIIHGETKLNMICPVGGDAEKRYGRPYHLLWCANLIHPSTPVAI